MTRAANAILCCAALLAAHPGLCAAGSARPIAAAPPPAPLVTIPFEESGSSVFLPVSVNGSRPYWFILDSGANSCVLDAAVASTLGLQPQGPGEATGAGQGPISYLSLAPDRVSFRLKDLTFSCQHTIAIDLAEAYAVPGHEMEGILGSDFFQRYVVEIDYDTRVVRLFEPATFEYRGRGEKVPLVFEKRVPHVMAELTVAGLPAEPRKLLIDSGSEDAVDDEILLRSTGPKREVTAGVGSGQEYKATFGSISRFRLGSIVLEDVPGVAPGVALIGGEVLRRFTATFDYTRQRLYLEPNRHLLDGFGPADEQGMGLRLAADRKNVRVHEVYRGSLAEKAGLKAGDLIVAIDGAPTSELGFRRTLRLLQRSGQSFRLQVQRGSQILEMVLTEQAKPGA